MVAVKRDLPVGRRMLQVKIDQSPADEDAGSVLRTTSRRRLRQRGWARHLKSFNVKFNPGRVQLKKGIYPRFFAGKITQTSYNLTMIKRNSAQPMTGEVIIGNSKGESITSVHKVFIQA